MVNSIASDGSPDGVAPRRLLAANAPTFFLKSYDDAEGDWCFHRPAPDEIADDEGEEEEEGEAAAASSGSGLQFQCLFLGSGPYPGYTGDLFLLMMLGFSIQSSGSSMFPLTFSVSLSRCSQM